MSIATYTIQDWLFDRAQGRFEIDLAESGVQYQLLSDLPLEPGWDLDYSLDRGTPELRGRIAALYAETAVPPDADHRAVIVTHGAQEALYLLYRSTLAAGDHVITTAPGWQQAWEVPAHIGCEVSVLDWRPGSPFDADALASAVRPNTRMLILNSPGNPSGQTLTSTEWDAILRVAGSHDLLVVNDEEYLLDFGASVVRRHPRAVSVSGLSKVYGMPALRVGWARGPEDVIERMVNYKRYTTVSNSVVWERAAARVIADRDRHIARYRSLVAPGLQQLETFAREHESHLQLVGPHGTPFAWVRFTSVPVSSQQFAEQLLDQQRTLVMPAEVFGAENGVRISYARPADVLAEGLRRVSAQLAAVV
jgi:aspartate/methionine/tyrosine aminotransferase